MDGDAGAPAGGAARRIAAAVGLADRAGGAPRLLLSGAAAPGSGPAAHAAVGLLTAVSADLQESPDRRSEPDVIVLWDDLVIVIEAKLGSANDRQTRDLRRFNRYLRRPEQWATSREEIKAAGLYELVRNWVIAWELAERTRATHAVLANLAPARLCADVTRFSALAAAPHTRGVAHMRWASLLADPAPAWLEHYATDLGLRTL